MKKSGPVYDIYSTFLDKFPTYLMETTHFKSNIVNGEHLKERWWDDVTVDEKNSDELIFIARMFLHTMGTTDPSIMNAVAKRIAQYYVRFFCRLEPFTGKGRSAEIAHSLYQKIIKTNGAVIQYLEDMKKPKCYNKPKPHKTAFQNQKPHNLTLIKKFQITRN